MRQNDLMQPDLLNDHNTFSIILHSKSVFGEEDQRYIQAYDFLNLTREETLVVLLGKNGNLLSPQQIYDHLELVDWDDYRKIIEKIQNKGILVNTLSEKKKAMLSSYKGISKRDIKRLKIRTPKDCEEGMKRLGEVLKEIGYAPKVTRDYIFEVQRKLGKTAIYYSANPIDLTKTLRALNLTDNANAPTSILRTIWGGSVNKPHIIRPISNKTNKIRDIYIENIDYDTQPEELESLFLKFGKVIQVSIPKDISSGRGRGIAFVKMENEEHADNAIRQLTNTMINNRIVRLNWSRQ